MHGFFAQITANSVFAGMDRVGFSIVTEADEAVVIDGAPTEEWQASAPMNTVNATINHVLCATTIIGVDRLVRTTIRHDSSSASTRARKPTARRKSPFHSPSSPSSCVAKVSTECFELAGCDIVLCVASTSNIVEFDDYDDYDDGEFQMLGKNCFFFFFFFFYRLLMVFGVEVIYKCLTFGQVRQKLDLNSCC
jgi:hypothetical protein